MPVFMETITIRDKKNPLAWLGTHTPRGPVMLVNEWADVPSAALRELRRAYKDASVLLVQQVRQFGKHSELIDGRFHERPLIAESTVGMGACVLTPYMMQFAARGRFTSLAKLFNAARDENIPFLTHEWVPLQKKV